VNDGREWKMGSMDGKIVMAKQCYEHLGGTLGCRLFRRLVELQWFEPDAENPRHYRITETGRINLEKLGVDVYDRGALCGTGDGSN
jgi:hypothetical protein